MMSLQKQQMCNTRKQYHSDKRLEISAGFVSILGPEALANLSRNAEGKLKCKKSTRNSPDGCETTQPQEIGQR